MIDFDHLRSLLEPRLDLYSIIEKPTGRRAAISENTIDLDRLPPSPARRLAAPPPADPRL